MHNSTTSAGIAYETRGSGRPDLLLIPDGFLPMASFDRLPQYAQFISHLASFGRLITFDRRGIGASASVGDSDPWRLSDWADDAAGTLDAVGSPDAVVVALAEGAITAVAFAARHPARVAALVLLNATPGPTLGPLARRGEGPRYIDFLRSTLGDEWIADPPGQEILAPSLEGDQEFSAWLTEAFRQAGDPRRFLRAFDLALRSDVRTYVAQVHAPALVIHRRDNRWFSADHGRVLARAIANAQYLELPGADHAPYIGETNQILDPVQWFIAGLDLDAPSSALTPRQAQVLELVRVGLTDKEIAARTGLSHRTVQKHLQLAYRKLGVSNRTAAATSRDRGLGRGKAVVSLSVVAPARERSRK